MTKKCGHKAETQSEINKNERSGRSEDLPYLNPQTDTKPKEYFSIVNQQSIITLTKNIQLSVNAKFKCKNQDLKKEIVIIHIVYGRWYPYDLGVHLKNHLKQ